MQKSKSASPLLVTPELADRVQALRDSGLAYGPISERVGVSISTVQRIVKIIIPRRKKNGIQRKV